MLLRKYKLNTLLNSNPQFFILMKLLPMDTKNFLALKKALKDKNFEIKFLSTKEALGIFKKINPLKKEISALLTSNLVLIQPIHKSTLQEFPLASVEQFPLIFVGFCFEGLFYHSKTAREFQFSVESLCGALPLFTGREIQSSILSILFAISLLSSI